MLWAKGVENICTCARADVSPFPYFGNGWTDCAGILCMARDPLARHFAEVNDGTQLHVRTPIRIYDTAGLITLKFVCG